MPAPHPPEFRRRAVELARERAKPIAEIAKDLRISESCLRNWLTQSDVDAGGSDRCGGEPARGRRVERPGDHFHLGQEAVRVGERAGWSG